MIGGVLTFLRQHLDAHLRTELGETPDDPSSDKIVFVDGDKFEPITFKLAACPRSSDHNFGSLSSSGSDFADGSEILA